MKLEILKHKIKADIELMKDSDYQNEPWHVKGCEVEAWIVAAIYEDFLELLEKVK